MKKQKTFLIVLATVVIVSVVLAVAVVRLRPTKFTDPADIVLKLEDLRSSDKITSEGLYGYSFVENGKPVTSKSGYARSFASKLEANVARFSSAEEAHKGFLSAKEATHVLMPGPMVEDVPGPTVGDETFWRRYESFPGYHLRCVARKTDFIIQIRGLENVHLMDELCDYAKIMERRI